MQACNTNSECSAWSSVRTFRTALPAPISLAQDSSIQDLRPNLTWNMPAYPGTPATGYTVQVSRNSSFTQVVATGTATSMSYTPTSDLPRSLTLFWHVRANGANGPSAWSDFGTYTTGNPPSTPSLSAPASNALVTSYTPLLDWSNSIVPLGAPAFDHYLLQVDDNPDFSSPLINQNSACPGHQFQCHSGGSLATQHHGIPGACRLAIPMPSAVPGLPYAPSVQNCLLQY